MRFMQRAESFRSTLNRFRFLPQQFPIDCIPFVPHALDRVSIESFSLDDVPGTSSLPQEELDEHLICETNSDAGENLLVGFEIQAFRIYEDTVIVPEECFDHAGFMKKTNIYSELGFAPFRGT